MKSDYNIFMAVLNFDHTLATIIKIKNDLSKLLQIITVLTQVLFIGFYTYQIVVNVEHLVLLIIYSVLAGLSFLYLLYYLIRLKGMAERVKRIESRVVRRLFRIGKYVLKAGAIGLAIYQIVVLPTSQTMILLTALSAFLLLFNIIAEVVITYVDGAIDRVMLAYSMDRDENILNKLISGDLNRNNFAIADEAELREKIKSDKEKYIKPAPEPTEPDPWWLRKAKNFLNKQVNKRVSKPDDVIDVTDDK